MTVTTPSAPDAAATDGVAGTGWPRRVRPSSAATCPSGCAPGTAPRPARPTRPLVVLRTARRPAPAAVAPGRARRRPGLRDRRARRRGRPRRRPPPRLAVARERGLAGRRPRRRRARDGACVGAARARRASASRRAPPASQARITGRLHSRGRDRARDQPPLRPLQRLLRADPRPARWPTPAATARRRPRRTPLEDAQRDKLDLVCRKLGLEPGMRLLDVGCGWGSLSLHAAEHFGAHGHRRDDRGASRRRSSTPGSPSAASSDRVEIRLQDYREVARRPASTRSPRSRWASTSASATTRRTPRCCAARCAPGGRVLVQQMSRTGQARPAAARSSSRSSRPTCTCARSARPSRCSSAAGSRCATCTRCASTTCCTVAGWLEHFEAHRDRARRAGRRGGRAGLAALPRRRRAGLRARAGWASTRS